MRTLVAVLLAGCINLSYGLEAFSDMPSGGSQDLFTVHGSNTIGASLAPNLVVAYLKAKGAEQVEIIDDFVENQKFVRGYLSDTRTYVRVAIEAHGSGTGFKGLANSRADIAAASRPIKDKEYKLLADMADMRSQFSEHIVGIDGLAVIVHPDNPVNDLSVREISEIFSGGYQDWSELGGKPGPINVYARDDKSGTWDSFKGMVLGKKKSLVSSARRYESNDVLSGEVSSDPGGIGFVGLASVRSAKAIAVSDGNAKALLPNKLTVATEDYALARRLFMYTPGQSDNQYVREFLEFTTADDGQKVVAETGFVSQELQALVPDFYDELPQDFKEITEGAQRLTINFRFRKGSARLDNKALKDIDRLVTFLQRSPDHNEIVLIGLVDKQNTEKRSKLLSKLRAMAVRRELVRNGIYPRSSIGYGGYLPVASTNRSAGRMKNRRVEVWLRHSDNRELASLN